MKVIHQRTETILANDLKLATSFFERLKGLMFIDKMSGMDALLLDPCNSVHNCFVRFPLDVIFLTSDNQIVKIVRNFKPWRFTRIYFSARKTLELPAGTVGNEVCEGDYLEVRGV